MSLRKEGILADLVFIALILKLFWPEVSRILNWLGGNLRLVFVLGAEILIVKVLLYLE